MTGKLKLIADIIHSQWKDEGYQHKPLRIGMVIKVDPTAFILMNSPLTKEPVSDVVTKTTVVDFGSGVRMHRLYLGDDNFIQVMLDSNGAIVEARYFSFLREVNPPDAEEWRVWLDPKDGLMFGKEIRFDDADATFTRHWGPSLDISAPVSMGETGEPGADVQLFSRVIGKGTEYLMVAVVPGAVKAYTGLDLNPSSLS